MYYKLYACIKSFVFSKNIYLDLCIVPTNGNMTFWDVDRHKPVQSLKRDWVD